MFIAYCVLAVLYSGMLIMSGVTKLQLHPEAVRIIHEVVGVPLGFFPLLAALEFAAAIGLLAGIRWARLGIAAAIGAMVYFVGAIVSHLLVGDLPALAAQPSAHDGVRPVRRSSEDARTSPRALSEPPHVGSWQLEVGS